jgi:hypothetical protein
MKSLLLIVMIALPTTAFAVDNPRKFQAYKDRLAERKAYATARRQVINAARPRAHGWLAIHRPDVNIMSPIVPLDRGVVSQPPIPMRQVFGVPYYESYGY